MSSIEIFKELRELQAALHATLADLKRAAAFYKNDRASLAVFVQGCLDTRRFPQLPNQIDSELESFLDGQFQFLKAVLPDAHPSFLELIFNTHVGTEGMEKAIYDAISHQSYPKKIALLIKEEAVFDVQLYCQLVPDPMGSFTHTNYIMTERMVTEAVDYLVTIFGEDKRAEITSNVQEKQSLYLSYTKMLEVIGEAPKQLFSSVKTRPQPKTFDNSPDYGQVFEKLFIENERAILFYLERKRQEENGEPPRECSICLDHTTKMIKICNDGHEICGKCLKDHTELLYHQGVLFFPCAFEHCSLILSNAVVRSVWDTSRYSKLLEDRKNTVVTDERLLVCPFCCFQNENADSPETRCIHCWKIFCVSCRKAGHLPRECNMEADYCKLIEECMTLALARKCPTCQKAFVKESGTCNQVTCCNVDMCYVCRKVIGDPRDHFYAQGIMPSEAPGKCPRFSDINTLHVDSVINAGKEMAQKIMSENPDVMLPYDPLAVLPKREESDAVPNQF